MNKYKVDLEYLIPEFSEIELEAVSDLDAANKAMEQIERLYPESQDIEILSVSVVQ